MLYACVDVLVADGADPQQNRPLPRAIDDGGRNAAEVALGDNDAGHLLEKLGFQIIEISGRLVA